MIILKEFFGLKTILSLRDSTENMDWEEREAGRLGIDFINIAMDTAQEQPVEKIKECLDIITDKERQPIFVHCHGGKDRTGLIFAAYRMKYDRWGIEDAYKEMLAYGYNENYYKLNESLRRWYDYLRD
jgi:protein tyrosine/serine phosphatase